MMSKSWNIYMVGCEAYDKSWLVAAVNKVTAVKLVQELTESYGWHLDYPDEKRTWEVNRMFERYGTIVETSDI